MASGKKPGRAPGAAGLSQLFADRLAESGLTAADAKRLGLSPLTAAQTGALGREFKPRMAMRIPYFSTVGAKTGFYRVRYLGKASGLEALIEKPQRYVQPSGTDPEVYLPPLAPWGKISSNPEVPLYFTEGEFKSAKACREGLPCLGLGGVWSWRSKKKGVALVPALASFAWKGRDVRMVFDSDFRTNPQVMRALVALSKELASLGARPHLVALPESKEGTKVGLDDFLVERGRKEFDLLAAEAAPFSQSEELWALNGEVVYIRDPGLVVVLADGRRVAASSFKEHAFSNRFYWETQVGKDGDEKMVKKPAAKAWLEWEQRAELARTTYAPGEPRVTADGELNYWPGWGVLPKRGDVRPWKELLDYLFEGEPGGRQWFERWCAFPIQHPGFKMYSAAVMWGVMTGTGKSLVGYTLMRVYGKNGTEINDRELETSYNEWAENKQFVMGDDVTGAEHKKKWADRLKSMITQREIRLNPKYIPSYTVPDRINYYFTSQHPDAFFVEDADRRYFVHEAPRRRMPQQFYKDYERWYLSDDGAAALFHHLLTLDLGDFDPRAAAYETQAKRAMIADGRSDLGEWVARLRDDPESVLRLGDMRVPGDLFTNTQLLSLYDPEGKGRVSANGMGRELKRAGLRQVNGGAVVRTDTGPLRLYAIRDGERWSKASAVEAAREWAKARGKEAPKQEKQNKY